MARSRKKADHRAAGQEPQRGVDLTPLMDFVGYTVRRAQIAVFGDFLDALRDVELRPAQFGVLMVIDRNPGLRQSDACAVLGIQKANFVPLLNELESRGLVVREPGTTDRRSYALHLTPQGRALLQRACELHAEHEARLTERIGKNGRAQLLNLLNRLADGQERRG
jgi:DNA-binding MarR family transcriptional regulator